MRRAFTNLTLDERRTIAKLLQAKTPRTRIAEILGRDRSTIRREIRRNWWHDAEVPQADGYWHVSAQALADARRTRRRKLERLTGRYDALCTHYRMTATRNNRGVAHENGAIESAHGHLKAALRDALLMRGHADFADLAGYRGFIDEVTGRRNAARRARIAAERAYLQALPSRRTTDFEEIVVTVSSTGGFTLRKVFYTVPSRLIGHRLRVRLYDDRLELFMGGTALMVLTRGRAHPDGRHDQVVNYHHVIHALRRKPMALLNLVYRDKLFPRPAYRRSFETLIAELSERQACRITVDLLALAHERGCECALAEELDRLLDQGQLPDPLRLRALFGPDPADLPTVSVLQVGLDSYDALVATATDRISIGGAA